MNIILESLKQAFRALVSHKFRSFLTMLGMIIGIFSVTTLITIGEGAKVYVTTQIQSLGIGSTAFIVASGQPSFSPPVAIFTYADLNYLENKIPEISGVVGIVPSSGEIIYGKITKKAPAIVGTTANYAKLIKQNINHGRFFTESEVNSRQKVAVLGSAMAAELFGNFSPLGERIKIKGIPYRIIGVLSPKGSIGTFDFNKQALIPATTAQNLMGDNKIMRMLVFTHSEKNLVLAREKTKQSLLKRYKADDFSFFTQQGLLDIVDKILSMLTSVVAGIAAIALLVGGIGIMNIMLVAVNERVREIGIRKAIGAKKRDILLQFLIESIIISLLGGIIGLLFSALVSYGIMYGLKMFVPIPVYAIILAISVSSAVGIFFGVYPAMRAASLVPVEALRYE